MTTNEIGPILTIRMQVRCTDCNICGTGTEHFWGVPTFNGDIVSNAFPDWLCREDGAAEASWNMASGSREVTGIQ